MKAALGSGLGFYSIGVVLALVLGVMFDQFVLLLIGYGLAGIAALAAIFMPASWRPWPLLLAALPAIPFSFLYALFLFPFFLPITALLLLGALRTFPPDFSADRAYRSQAVRRPRKTQS